MNNLPTQNRYKFTSDWFTSNISVWDQIIGPLKPLKILEIGSYEGRATTWLIENCGNSKGCEIHCIDPWAEYSDLPGYNMLDVEKRFDQNIEIAKEKNKNVQIYKYKKTSVIALAELIAHQKSNFFDLIYVDGSHQAPDVLSDAIMSSPLLKIGGVMIFDDYLWHMEAVGDQDPLNMPKPAIDAFINIFQRKYQIIANKPLYQLYVRKIKS